MLKKFSKILPQKRTKYFLHNIPNGGFLVETTHVDIFPNPKFM
jgi:hypothetical protein